MLVNNQLILVKHRLIFSWRPPAPDFSQFGERKILRPNLPKKIWLTKILEKINIKIVISIYQCIPAPNPLILIAGFKAGVVGLNVGYPKKPALKPRKPS